MFRKIEWDIASDYHGERELEVAWIRRQLKGVKNKTVADFGAINYGNRDGCSRWLGIEAYDIDPSNETLAFDKSEFPELRGRCIKADLMTPNFYKAESVDIGISVSVIEHIGINCSPRILSGDTIALRNIYDTIKPGGTLLVTVPVNYAAGQPAENIRVYSPVVLRECMTALFGACVEYEYYRYIHPYWMQALSDEGCGHDLDYSLEEMARAVVANDKRRGVASLACLTIGKPA